MYARGVRDGSIVDPKFLPVLYEFPKPMIDAGEHRKLENAYVTNPNWGLSVDEEFIEQRYKQAVIDGEEEFRGFLAKHLNVEIGLALMSDRWPGADFWEAAGRKMSLDEFLEQVEVVDVGIDGGGLDDLLGLALIGRERGSARWLAWMHAWAHPSVLERRKSEAARFGDFAKDGHLTLVQRIGDDVDEVADIVARIYAAGLLDKVGVDVAGIGAIVDAIEARDIDREKYIVGVSQGWRLAGAIKTTERRLAGGELFHDASPLMAWCVGNAKVEPRANSMLITKQSSGSAKIDPLMALFNAVTLLSLNPQSDAIGSDYELMVA
jgi:phage terminase large subunit-like protein